MRWKARFFLTGEQVKKISRILAFRLNKTPPTFLELKSFEEDVVTLLENIKFRYTFSTHFGKRRKLKKINLSHKMFVFTDKTRNIYETSLDTYNKLLHDNITSKHY